MCLSPTALKLALINLNRMNLTSLKRKKKQLKVKFKKIILVYIIKKVQQSGLMPIAMGLNLN